MPGKITLGDYHFQMSNKTLRNPATGTVNVASNDNLEIFDYSDYAHRFHETDKRLEDVEKHGDDVAKRRMEEQAAAHLQISGTSTCRAFSTGYYFSLLGKDEQPKKVPGTEGKYVLTSLKHSIQQDPEYISGGDSNQPYRNAFSCIQQEIPYRPAHAAPARCRACKPRSSVD